MRPSTPTLKSQPNSNISQASTASENAQQKILLTLKLNFLQLWCLTFYNVEHRFVLRQICTAVANGTWWTVTKSQIAEASRIVKELVEGWLVIEIKEKGVTQQLTQNNRLQPLFTVNQAFFSLLPSLIGYFTHDIESKITLRAQDLYRLGFNTGQYPSCPVNTVKFICRKCRGVTLNGVCGKCGDTSYQKNLLPPLTPIPIQSGASSSEIESLDRLLRLNRMLSHFTKEKIKIDELEFALAKKRERLMLQMQQKQQNRLQTFMSTLITVSNSQPVPGTTSPLILPGMKIPNTATGSKLNNTEQLASEGMYSYQELQAAQRMFAPRQVFSKVEEMKQLRERRRQRMLQKGLVV